MNLRPLKLPGTYEIVLQPHRDDRGYFLRLYDDALFRSHGLTTAWVQENQSWSNRKGLIRGLHFQNQPWTETKLVRVVVGTIWDVFVDLRKGSPTYGSWDAIELSADRHHQLYLPKGFAHGFCTLTGEALVQYKVDAVYSPDLEDGLRYNDDVLRIPWPVAQPFLSPKDTQWPLFCERGPVYLDV
jgi:dTDP-4-dehydrorhamnose 3,5-epimerase